jgi:hypothetical protein
MTTYASQYPPEHSDTYVKATSSYSYAYRAFFATDPANSLTGTHGYNQWCSYPESTNQRFHIDLGSACVIKRIYYENGHISGGSTNVGVKDFTFWGSNDATAFATLTYATDDNWTQLTTDQSSFEQHVSSDVADPHYIEVTNTTGYRYYAIKFANGYLGGHTMHLRRVELQSATANNYEHTVESGADLTDSASVTVERDGAFLYVESVSDILSPADTINTITTMPFAADDYIDLVDAISLYYMSEILDTLDLSDASLQAMTFLIEDSMAVEDSNSLDKYLTNTISEAIFLYCTIQTGWNVSTESTITLTDAVDKVLGIAVNDWLTLVASETNNWNGSEVIPDALNLFDVAIGARAYVDTIEESLVVTDESLYKLTVAVLEYLGFTDLANAIKTIAASISESVELSDAPSHALSFLISEALAAVDSLSVINSIAGAIQDSLGLTEALSTIKRLGLAVDDPLTLSETVTSQGALYSAVYDTLAMNITVELNGETYECYVLNTPKFMPSMYSGFDFNSYCVFEDRAFGANDTGVFELTGPTDAGNVIHTGAVLSDTDFGSRNNKRFRKGYLAVSGDSPLMILETEDGGRQAYTVDTGGMTVFSHDQKSKKWKISIADFETLESINLIPVVLSK